MSSGAAGGSTHTGPEGAVSGASVTLSMEEEEARQKEEPDGEGSCPLSRQDDLCQNKQQQAR